MEAFRWIIDYLSTKVARSSLNDLIPNRFNSYAFIPWTIGIIDNFPFAEYPENNESLENLNRQHEIQQEFGIFLNSEIEYKYREISLKELSERFGVQYCADTAFLIKSTPGILYLSNPMLHKLTEMLTSLRKDSELCLYVEDNFRFEAAKERWQFKSENILQKISDYLVFQQQTSWDSTSYLFLENLDWCLITAEDFPHFIFCGNESAFRTMKGSTKLEVFPVDYSVSLDSVCA